MAKVKGPLFSLEASGTLANTIVFSKWKGRQYTRKHTIPENPQTAKQVNVRKAFTLIIAYWHDVGAPTREIFNTFAEGTDKSGFNHFVSRAQKEYIVQLGSDTDPLSVTLAGVPPDETWTWTEVT